MDVSYVSHRLVVSVDHLEIFQSSAYLISVVFYSCYDVLISNFKNIAICL